VTTVPWGPTRRAEVFRSTPNGGIVHPWDLALVFGGCFREQIGPIDGLRANSKLHELDRVIGQSHYCVLVSCGLRCWTQRLFQPQGAPERVGGFSAGGRERMPFALVALPLVPSKSSCAFGPREAGSIVLEMEPLLAWIGLLPVVIAVVILASADAVLGGAVKSRSEAAG
jgi:hypothetical protein